MTAVDPAVRLGSIQSSTDGFTFGVLDGLGLPPDAHCLDLGAGAGSVAEDLVARCPRGRVVAVDIDVSHLADSPAEVVEADITDPAFDPGAFDLVHARFVLCHLAARDDVLARAAGWLRPGGWLVVTDPFQLPEETAAFPVVARIMAAYRKLQTGADLTWVRGVPSRMGAAGLADIGFAARPACMGNLDRDRWRPLIDQAAPALLARGLVTEDDLAEFRSRLLEPAFVDIPQISIAVWGRKPCIAGRPQPVTG
ncbi:class I SAM-dependent methyltransferase [Actinokineospora fastidiosa]|uniref:Methyltransferase n=1 Tax=Actinokineospora fastidiosa TaxID=1816 RepID=A0A918GEV9_9PSEU|nr:class I SAM-dependent methyltransferase [Actinokineospora fastidiosa]GGS31273.1 methyltransferase [Actinokineospora fastidiosa]